MVEPACAGDRDRGAGRAPRSGSRSRSSTTCASSARPTDTESSTARSSGCGAGRSWMAEHPDDAGFAPPGGESFAEVYDRVERLKALTARASRASASSRSATASSCASSSSTASSGADFTPAQVPAHVAAADAQLRAERLPAPPARARPLAYPSPEEWLCLTWMARPWDPAVTDAGRLAGRDLVAVVDLSPGRRLDRAAQQRVAALGHPPPQAATAARRARPHEPGRRPDCSPRSGSRTRS